MSNLNRTYKTPTRAANNRATAHALIVRDLRRLAANLRAQGADAVATIVTDEANRQQDMLDDYRRRYGPNAQVVAHPPA